MKLPNTDTHITHTLSPNLFEKQKLLVVDDNPINLSVARAFLKKWGAFVDTAENGAEALTLFERHAYDCILMDLHMPVMSGLDASKKIREHELLQQSLAHCPIIAFTADVFMKDDVLEQHGIDDRLHKPFKPQVLQQLLVKHLFTDNTRIDEQAEVVNAGNFY